MARLKQGDRVLCKLSLGKLVNSYSSDFDETQDFVIIGLDNQGYCIYVPSYFQLNGTCVVEHSDCRSYKIDTKYLGENMYYIIDSQIFSIYSKMDGCVCLKCKEFHYQASSNQENGEFICWLCRNYKYR